jgi:hypothetical protein
MVVVEINKIKTNKTKNQQSLVIQGNKESKGNKKIRNRNKINTIRIRERG